MTVQRRVASAQRPLTALGTVAAGARDALGSPDWFLRGVQQTIQHLADRAVLAVERIGVHVRYLLRNPPLLSLQVECLRASPGFASFTRETQSVLINSDLSLRRTTLGTRDTVRVTEILTVIALTGKRLDRRIGIRARGNVSDVSRSTNGCVGIGRSAFIQAAPLVDLRPTTRVQSHVRAKAH